MTLPEGRNRKIVSTKLYQSWDQRLIGSAACPNLKESSTTKVKSTLAKAVQIK